MSDLSADGFIKFKRKIIPNVKDNIENLEYENSFTLNSFQDLITKLFELQSFPMQGLHSMSLWCHFTKENEFFVGSPIPTSL